MTDRPSKRSWLKFFHGPAPGRRINIAFNPFNHKNPMSLKDALKVSALAATATYCLTFLYNLTLPELLADPLLVAFDSLKTWLATFWGTLITLAGLEKYVHRREEKESKEG